MKALEQLCHHHVWISVANVELLNFADVVRAVNVPIFPRHSRFYFYYIFTQEHNARYRLGKQIMMLIQLLPAFAFLALLALGLWCFRRRRRRDLPFARRLCLNCRKGHFPDLHGFKIFHIGPLKGLRCSIG